MTRAPEAEWQRRCNEHRRAIGGFVAQVDRLEESAWLRRPAPDKWCPGQIAEHVLLTYDALLRELDGGVGMRARGSWWRRLILRRRLLPALLKEGRFPPGAPAVREIRPGESPRPREVVVAELRERAARFEERLARAFAAGGGRLTHPFFGTLPAPDALRFVAVHTEHHRGQVPEVRA